MIDIENHLLRGTSSTVKQEAKDKLTVAALLGTIEKMRRIVVVQEIWVVCRPDMELKMQDLAQSTSTLFPVLSVPMYMFDSLLFNPEQEMIAAPDDDLWALRRANPTMRVYPFFCKFPGVYLMMSDGSVRTVIC